MKTFLTILLFLAAVPAIAAAADMPPLPVDQALVAGPVAVNLPAFGDAELAGTTLADLRDALPAVPGGAWPHAGDPLAGPGDQASSWQTVRADHGGFALKGKGPRVAYYAFTLSSDRWQKATLRVVTGMKVKGSCAFTDLDLKSGEQDTLTTELTLPRGKYLVSLRAFADGSEDEDTRVALQVVPGEQAADGSLVPGVSAERAVEIHTVLDAPRVSDLELSPDGSLVAISLGEYGNGTDRETWLEIRDTADGRLVRYWRDGGSPSGLKWRDTG